jgi:actin-related protein
MQATNYSSIIIDLGSGLIKSGFSGEDGPRNIFNSIVGIPKMAGLKVGMEQKERFVGDEAIENLEFMNYFPPIKRGEVADWDKFETLMHYLLYNQMEVVPEEMSVLITETPLSSKENRAKVAEMLFEKFDVEKYHMANSSMLGLFSYGKTSGIVVDSGFNVTSTVPIYEGFPLQYASKKINLGGEDISLNLLESLKDKLEPSYKLIKGRLLADDIKEHKGYISMDNEEKEEEKQEESPYKLPDGKELKLGNEIFKTCDILFNPPEDNKDLMSVSKMVAEALACCDDDVRTDINESICLIGGTTLMKNFPEKLKNELSDNKDFGNFNLSFSPERQFSSWVGGSIFSSLDNFHYMWVTKDEYDEKGKTLVSIDSKCF